MTPEYICLHTAAHAKDGVPQDTTAAEIDAWHKAPPLNWRCIGYHYVIRFDGKTEYGRLISEQGAHVKGLNARSIGICFSGHGDIQPFTQQQLSTMVSLCGALMSKFNIPIENVIGHREIRDLIEAGVVDRKYWTTKTCPGSKVDMNRMRKIILRTEMPETDSPMITYRTTAPTDRDEIERVKSLQTLLLLVDGYTGAVDGWSGPLTSNATKTLLGSYLVGDPRKV